MIKCISFIITITCFRASLYSLPTITCNSLLSAFLSPLCSVTSPMSSPPLLLRVLFVCVSCFVFLLVGRAVNLQILLWSSFILYFSLQVEADSSFLNISSSDLQVDIIATHQALSGIVLSVKPSLTFCALSIYAIFYRRISLVGGEGHYLTLISEYFGQNSSPFNILTRYDSLIMEEESFGTKNPFLTATSYKSSRVLIMVLN